MTQKKAVSVGDLAHYRLPVMKRRVAQALTALEMAQEKGRLGVSFSGGKDSTVLASLARIYDAAAPLGFFDSGCEYPETVQFVQDMGAEVLMPQKSLREMLREGGYWGYAGAEADPDITFDFRAYLVNEPSRQFVVRCDLSVVAIGLREEESAGRRMLGKGLYSKGQGPLLFSASQDCWQAYPLLSWTHEDIWAYIAGRDLPYNPVYDRMAALDIPREEWRVSTLLGEAGVSLGRFARLRFLYPALFNELSAEFPKITRHT